MKFHKTLIKTPYPANVTISKKSEILYFLSNDNPTIATPKLKTHLTPLVNIRS